MGDTHLYVAPGHHSFGITTARRNPPKPDLYPYKAQGACTGATGSRPGLFAETPAAGFAHGRRPTQSIPT